MPFLSLREDKSALWRLSSVIKTNHKIEFYPEKCVGCGLCYKACFVDVIRWDAEAKKPLFLYVNDCEHCFYCEAVCNKDAIKVIPDYKSERLFQSFERYN